MQQRALSYIKWHYQSDPMPVYASLCAFLAPVNFHNFKISVTISLDTAL